MKLMKTFGTAKMSKAVFQRLLNDELIVVDGFCSYQVGLIVQESNPAYTDFYKEFDNYLIADGAEMGETILIAHGENW